ncbi:MAG: AlpA family phage regulatory protein [Pseudoxanthomonas sp.]
MSAVVVNYPDDALLRVRDITSDRKKGTQGLFPISRSLWWEGVRSGRFPKPVKLSPGVTAWRMRDLRDLIERGAL